MIRRLLVANRGEIAVRVIRACRELGIETVAVCSEVDRRALHARLADIAVPIGPAPAIDSYLCIERLIEAARTSGADAVHPGYGFLAENAGFARACADAELTFVGPPASVISQMGSKIESRARAMEAGLPIVPGVTPDAQDDEALSAAAERVGFPLLVKASAGGGGKGMRVVHAREDLAEAFASARHEAAGAFGDGRTVPGAAPARAAATSKSRSSETRMAASSTSSSASAPRSAATRRSSRRARRRGCPTPSAVACAMRPLRSRVTSATGTPGPSSSWSKAAETTRSSTSSR